MSTSEKQNKTKVMVFGTFDGLHPGHIQFFKQARHLAGKGTLIASIARDVNVKKIKKYTPKKGERTRMRLVKDSGLADKVVLGGVRDYLAHIVKESPDIIALGYDQKEYVGNLQENLKKLGLNIKIVRLKPYKEKIYKNLLIQKRAKI